MQAKIYCPTKSAMQSGVGNIQKWILEFNTKKGDQFIEGIMGWTASKDMNQEVRLTFDALEEAIRFANSHNFEYEIIEPHLRQRVKKSYADNFK